MLDQVVKEMVAESTVDYIGLWQIVRGVQRHAPEASRQAQRAMASGVVAALIGGQGMVAGDLRDDGFHRWTETGKDAIARIEREWSLLDGEPTLGDVVWLSARDASPEVGRLGRGG